MTGRRSLEERFWSRVGKRGRDDCWEWKGARSERGYGQISVGHRSTPAHRVSFLLAFGWEPPAVLHKCDNPPCVNPGHLFGGTQADNMADCASKWRTGSKVTPAIKATIFALREEGLTQAAIARQVNLNMATVRRTLTGISNPGAFEGDDRYEISVRPYNPLPLHVRAERARICGVKCPACDSPEGAKCRTRSGFVLEPPHVARRQVAS